MNKDFWFVLILTVVFFALASLRASRAMIAWRKVCLYFVYPTADTFLAAGRYASHLGQSWSEFFEAKREVEHWRMLAKQQKFSEIVANIHKEHEQVTERFEFLRQSGKTHPVLGSIVFSVAQVNRRAAGEEAWASLVCMQPENGENPPRRHNPVLQYSFSVGAYVLAGKMLGPEGSLGGYPCAELITSAGYALSVRLQSVDEVGFLKGLGRPNLMIIEYLPRDSKARAGELVVTTHSSWIAPPGIAVGEIVAVEPASAERLFTRAYVKPYLDLGRLQEVIIVRWQRSESAAPEAPVFF